MVGEIFNFLFLVNFIKKNLIIFSEILKKISKQKLRNLVNLRFNGSNTSPNCLFLELNNPKTRVKGKISPARTNS